MVIGPTDGTNSEINNIGILVTGNLNSIGGTDATAANTFAGNTTGLEIASGSANNLVEGNFIGAGGVGNQDGILIENATGNTIGGSVALDASGNVLALGGGNVIGFNTNGVRITGSNAFLNVVEGNFFGVDPTNPTRLGLPNTVGLLISAPFNSVGFDVSGPALDGPRSNVFGENTTGVSISGTIGFGNILQGNLIGTDRKRDRLPNSTGVAIDSAYGNLIGGFVAGIVNPALNQAANVFAFNATSGVALTGSFTDAQGKTQGNLIQGNFVGTDPNTDLLGNGTGITVGSPSNTIGPGTTVIPNPTQPGNATLTIGSPNASAGNVIAANSNSGIMISGDLNLVVGNTIGATLRGTLGNISSGVEITGGSSNTIGALDRRPHVRAHVAYPRSGKSYCGELGRRRAHLAGTACRLGRQPDQL